MKRAKHSLSHYKLLTCDMGQLIPIGCVEALPGDTIQHSTSLFIRVSPMMAPVMHPVQVRVHHFFVPHRLIWTQFEDFITGGSDGLGNGAVFPTNSGTVTPAIGSVWDYLGVPTGSLLPIGALSLLPIRGYNEIYNEFYRDQDLAPIIAPDTAGNPHKISWEKDYFTTCRPWTQKGPAVLLPLGTSASVKTSASNLVTGTGNPEMRWRRNDTGALVGNNLFLNSTGTGGTGITAGAGASITSVYPENLYADLSTATSAQINDLRRALALQRYQEARAQYGSRYTEYLRYLGIKSADQRLDRPEYLGGGKQTISFSEVLRTASDTASNPIGELRGHGAAALRSNKYRYYCEEHGYIFTLLSVRPKTVYVNGIPRSYTKRTKEDFYQRELELIGQQPVYNREVFMNGAAADGNIFGYQDRYSEYRHQESQVHSEFRSTVFDFWHMGRKFASLPTLNQSFIECDPTKRIHAVQTNQVLWVMANHDIVARRIVGNQVIGRIL